MYIAKIQKHITSLVFLIGAFLSITALYTVLSATPVYAENCKANGDNGTVYTNRKSSYGVCIGTGTDRLIDLWTNYYQIAVKIPSGENVNITGKLGNSNISFEKQNNNLYTSTHSGNLGFPALWTTAEKPCEISKYGVSVTVTGGGKSQTVSDNLCKYADSEGTLIQLIADQFAQGTKTGIIKGNLGTVRAGAPDGESYKAGKLDKAYVTKITLSGKMSKNGDSQSDWYTLSDGILTIPNLKPGTYNLTIHYNDCAALVADSGKSLADVCGRQTNWTSSDVTFDNFGDIRVIAGQPTWIAGSETATQYFDRDGKKTDYQDPGSNTDDDSNTCGAQVTGLGWIICPLLSTLTKANDGMWTLVSGLLTVNPISQNDSIYKAWGSIRSIANVLFVLFFLVIIFSQLTNIGITNYGVKKLLPKVIIAAVLVNVSYIIIQIAVDLANIIGSSLYGFIVGMAPEYSINWGGALQLLEGGAAALTGLAVTVAAVGGFTALFFLLLGVVLISLLGLLTAVLTLIFRQAAIIILAIMAPLAFVAYLLPNTESWFKKWRGLLMSMLMMYPMAALIFAGAQFAAATIIGNGTDFWNICIGLTMMALPLFSLPFIARQGGPILSRVNGALTGLANRANQPIRGWAKSHADYHKSQFQADNGQLRGGVLGGFQRFGRGLSAPSRHLSRAWESGRQNRETRTAAAKDEFKSQLSNNQVRGVLGRRINGEATDVRAAAAKERLGVDTTNTASRMVHQNPNVNARHGGEHINEAKYAAGLEKERVENRRDEGLANNLGFNAARLAADHAKSDAKAAADRAATRVESDPTTLQVRRNAFSADAELKTAQKITEGGIAADTSLDAVRSQLEEATVVAAAATDDASARIETDPGVRDAKTVAAGAKMRVETAQEETKQAIADDASLNIDREELKKSKNYAAGAESLAEARVESAPGVIESKVTAAAGEDKKNAVIKASDKIVDEAKRGIATPGVSAGAVTAAQAARYDLEKATLQATESSEGLAADLESDETLDEDRLAAEAAKKEHGVATAEFTQLATEAATDVTAAAGSRLSGASTGVRDRLRTTQTAANVAASATTQAQRVQTAEYTKELLDESTGAATAAAGIGGEPAKSRVQAAATAAQDKQRQEDVSAAVTLFEDEGLDTSTLRDVATSGYIPETDAGGNVISATKATDEQIEAAMQMVASTGSANKDAEMYNALAKLPDGTDEEKRRKLKLQQAYNKILLKAKRPKSIRGAILGKLAAGQVDTAVSHPDLTPFESIALEILQKGKLGPETFTEIDQEELNIWARVLSAKDKPVGKDDDGNPIYGKAMPLDSDQTKDLADDIEMALTNDLISKEIKPEQRVQMNLMLEALGRAPISERPPTTT